MTTLRWGIVGGGDVAERNLVPAFRLCDNAELVAVTNRHLDRARAFADKHAVAAAFDSIDAMVASPDVDAVYIATPNHLHAEHTIAAARAGKHVLCDKPMALTVDACERMIDACARHDVRLGVVFQNRFHPAHVEARQRIADGVLGEPQFATAQLCVGRPRGFWQGWRLDPVAAGSGAIVGQAVHPVDLLRFLFDSEVVEVQCMTDQDPPARPVDDLCTALLRFANGAHATVVAGTVVPRSVNGATLYGSDGRVVCNGTIGPPSAANPQSLAIDGTAGSHHESHASSTSPDRFAAMFADFGRAVAEHRDPSISGANGLQMVRIANALLASSREGRRIAIER